MTNPRCKLCGQEMWPEDCPDCEGEGGDGDILCPRTCDACNGKGWTWECGCTQWEEDDQ